MTSEPMTTYRFGIMSDVCEMEADCDTVAHAAAILCYQSDAPIVFYAPAQAECVLHFGQLNGGNVEANLNAHFGGDFVTFLQANKAQIKRALDSVREAGKAPAPSLLFGHDGTTGGNDDPNG